MNSESIDAPENIGAEKTVALSEGSAEKLSAIDLLKRMPTTMEDVDAIRAAAYISPKTWSRFDHYVREILKDDEPDFEQKKTFGLALLGHYELAEGMLEKMKNLPVAACLLGRLYLDTERQEKAVEIFRNIHQRVPEVHAYHVYLTEALEAAGDVDGFRRELEKLEAKNPDDPDTICFKAIAAELDGEYEEAKALYNQVLEINPKHQKALFRMAYRLDLEGDDEEAMNYYRTCNDAGVSNAAALTNLGILYEDAERYEDAAKCFALVNRIYPNETRARLFLRDTEACESMYYDEEKEKKEDKQAQILRIPVTDFELSVRSRNCLSKMNIRTLGDLISKTEVELLAFKNFGETSLQEIKGILASKGLRLGMITPDTDELPTFLEPVQSGNQDESIFNKPLDELDLSVRSRNCLNYLQIKTLGQLAETTEQQLVACKNFGQTSLNEIRKKLSDFGLSLKV